MRIMGVGKAPEGAALHEILAIHHMLDDIGGRLRGIMQRRSAGGVHIPLRIKQRDILRLLPRLLCLPEHGVLLNKRQQLRAIHHFTDHLRNIIARVSLCCEQHAADILTR